MILSIKGNMTMLMRKKKKQMSNCFGKAPGRPAT